MATFTMNSQKGITQAPAPKSVFDRAFVFSIGLIVLVGGLWALERGLIYLADKEIAGYRTTTAASLESMNPEQVQGIHDVTSRITAIKKYGAPELSIDALLGTLEKTTIPQVKLLEYEYRSDGAIHIKGLVSDYRFLAEQILRYRQDPSLATAEVVTTERTEDGQVKFTVEVEPAVDPTVTPSL